MEKIHFVTIFLVATFSAHGLDEIRLHPQSVSSSSFLFKNVNNIFPPGRIVDGDPTTSFVEGIPGNGEGSVLKFFFEEVVWIRKIRIANGFGENPNYFLKNGRLKSVKLDFYRGNYLIGHRESELEDTHDYQEISLVWPAMCDSVVLEVQNVFEGTSFKDTAVSEIEFYGYIRSTYSGTDYQDDYSRRKSIETFNTIQGNSYGYSVGGLGGVRIGFDGNRYVLHFAYAPIPFGEVQGVFAVFNDTIFLHPEKFILFDDNPDEANWDYKDTDLVPVEEPLQRSVLEIVDLTSEKLEVDFIEYDAHLHFALNHLYAATTMMPLYGSRPEVATTVLPLEKR